MAEVAEDAVPAPEAAAEEEPEQLAAWGNFTLTLECLSVKIMYGPFPKCVVVGKFTYHRVVERLEESLDIMFSTFVSSVSM